MNIRERFIKDYVGMLLSQRDMMGVRHWPEGTRNIYDAGVLATTAVTLSLTDSRVGNLANWRITNHEGEVVSFYPDPNDVHGAANVMGIIVAIQNDYKESVEHGYHVRTAKRD